MTQALARLVLGPRMSASLGSRAQQRMRRLKETLGHLDLDTCSLESYDLVTGQHTLTLMSVKC